MIVLKNMESGCRREFESLAASNVFLDSIDDPYNWVDVPGDVL